LPFAITVSIRKVFLYLGQAPVIQSLLVCVVVVSKKTVKLDLLSEKFASNGVGIDRSIAPRTVTAMPNPDKFVSKLSTFGWRSSPHYTHLGFRRM